MIHTRQQLLDWIGKHVDDRVLKLALGKGTVELLGGFNPLPGSMNSGWLVSVTYFNKTHLIAVAEDRKRLGRFYWFRASHVPWDLWIGNKPNDPLCQGDRPELYRMYKEGGTNGRFAELARRTDAYLPQDRCGRDDESDSRMGAGRGDQGVPPSTPGPTDVHDKKED